MNRFDSTHSAQSLRSPRAIFARRRLLAGAGLAACVACASPSPSASVPVAPVSGEALAASAGPEASSRELHAYPIDLMPEGVTTHGATTLGRAVYVLGGYTGSPHNYNQRDQSRAFSRFDLDSRRWEQLPSVGPIQSAVLVNDGRYVYRIGGMRAMNEPGQPEDMRSLTDVERFDPERGSWQPFAQLPAPRSSHQAVVIGTKLYVIGGWALAGGSFDSKYDETLLTCDLAAPQCSWQSEPLPMSVRAMGAAVHDGKIYLLGGLTPEGSSDAVHVYDPASKKWSAGPSLPKDNLTICAADMAGELFANGADGNVYRLAPDGSSWAPVASLVFPRMFHQIVGSPEGILVLGGIPSKARGARVRHVERVSFEPPPAGIAWTLPAESAAKNRQGSFLLGQQLYVFGGNNSLEQHDFEPKNFEASAHRLDIGSLEWRPAAAFPERRQSMQTWIAGTEEKPVGFAVGGFGWKGDRLSTQADIYRYDFAEGSWSLLPVALPQARSQFGLTVWNEGAWIFGGLDYEQGRKDEEFRHPTQVLRLDLARPEAGFTPAGLELSSKRRAFAAAMLGDRYYITGGLTESFQPVTSCEVLDLKTKAATPMACPGKHRLGGELVAIGGKLLLVGGSAANAEGKREPTSAIESYDPASDRWVTLTERLPLDTPKQMSAFAFRDRLLLYSANRQTQSAQLALIDPAALAAGRTPFINLTVAALPAPAAAGSSGPAAPAKP